MTRSRLTIGGLLAVAGALVLSAGTMADGRQEPGPALQDAALVEFDARVREYVALHRRLEGPVPTNRVSDDLGEIRAAMDALAARIQAERRNARQGDLFTPAAAPVIRRLIGEGCKGDFKRLLAIVSEETGPGVGRPRVNDRWPAGAAHPMIPPGVLRQLPPLPEELEYRFIGPDLLLWDMHADLIADVLPNAIPAT